VENINKMPPFIQNMTFLAWERKAEGRLLRLHDVDLSPGHGSRFPLVLADFRVSRGKKWRCTHPALQTRAFARSSNQHPPTKKSLLTKTQVTWDQHSIFVRGERIMFFSGEFHPFRLPSPGLWLDVFQKIKALGFSGVSFYTDWGLLEGNPGHVYTEGVFSLDEFFQAATEAGIYLLARPGPYINAETAAGGMPGWTLRLKGTLRSMAPDYLNSTLLYSATMGKIIADAQITNGGPVIMVQPENEYTTWPGVNLTNFPDQMNKEYMAFVEQQFRDAGIVVPFVVNDNQVMGDFAPGSGLGEVDLYGIDAYPMRYDCTASTLSTFVPC
jgi:beta-galactosidase